MKNSRSRRGVYHFPVICSRHCEQITRKLCWSRSWTVKWTCSSVRESCRNLPWFNLSMPHPNKSRPASGCAVNSRLADWPYLFLPSSHIIISCMILSLLSACFQKTENPLLIADSMRNISCLLNYFVVCHFFFRFLFLCASRFSTSFFRCYLLLPLLLIRRMLKTPLSLALREHWYRWGRRRAQRTKKKKERKKRPHSCKRKEKVQVNGLLRMCRNVMNETKRGRQTRKTAHRNRNEHVRFSDIYQHMF